MSLFKQYPPAAHDKTIYVFVVAAMLLLVVARALPSHFGRDLLPLAMALAVLALLLILAAPIVKWRRWSRDPGFQAFLAEKKSRIRARDSQRAP